MAHSDAPVPATPALPISATTMAELLSEVALLAAPRQPPLNIPTAELLQALADVVAAVAPLCRAPQRDELAQLAMALDTFREAREIRPGREAVAEGMRLAVRVEQALSRPVPSRNASRRAAA